MMTLLFAALALTVAPRDEIVYERSNSGWGVIAPDSMSARYVIAQLIDARFPYRVEPLENGRAMVSYMQSQPFYPFNITKVLGDHETYRESTTVLIHVPRQIVEEGVDMTPPLVTRVERGIMVQSKESNMHDIVFEIMCELGKPYEVGRGMLGSISLKHPWDLTFPTEEVMLAVIANICSGVYLTDGEKVAFIYAPWMGGMGRGFKPIANDDGSNSYSTEVQDREEWTK